MIWRQEPSQGPWRGGPVKSLPPAVPPVNPSLSRPMNPPSPDCSPSQTTSRNALFDVDWAPVTPNTRSRSSTVESRFSTASTSSSANRRSWMDVDPPTADKSLEMAQAPPFERRETVTSFHDATPVVGSQNESGFEWLPQTPVSPMRRLPISPHNSMPAFEPLPSAASPLTPPPPPPSLSRPGPAFPLTATSPPRPPSRPSPVDFPESAALPATAGHSANPLLDTRRAPSLRLSPSPTYLLGEGRHANVYLASCEPVEPVGSVRAERVPRRRRLCAAKRLFPDRDSQVSGLGEAFILAKLAGNADPAEVGSSNIIRLYGVRDERDGFDPPAPLPSSMSTSSRSSLRLSYGSGQTVPSPLGRTSSDLDGTRNVAMREVTASAGTAAAARRFGRKSARNSDTVLVDADAGHGKSKLSLLSHALDPPLSSSRRRTVSTPQPAAAPPAEPPSAGGLAPPFSLTPRIDLLLEFCPLGHVLQFARAHPECLDKARWFDWAKQLTGAVKWAHEKNVLHADIKPQNVLVSRAPGREADRRGTVRLTTCAPPADRFRLFAATGRLGQLALLAVADIPTASLPDRPARARHSLLFASGIRPRASVAVLLLERHLLARHHPLRPLDRDRAVRRYPRARANDASRRGGLVGIRRGQATRLARARGGRRTEPVRQRAE